MENLKRWLPFDNLIISTCLIWERYTCFPTLHRTFTIVLWLQVLIESGDKASLISWAQQLPDKIWGNQVVWTSDFYIRSLQDIWLSAPEGSLEYWVSKFSCFSFLPEASFGLRVMSLPVSVHPSIIPSVTKFVHPITCHPFKLESLNLDHRCKRP